MRIQIYGVSFKLSQSIIQHAQTKLQAALGAAQQQVRSAVISLSDINGDHGGDDKSCRITACTDRVGVIFIESINRDLYTAIQHAAAKLKQAIGNRLSRNRTLQRKAYRAAITD